MLLNVQNLYYAYQEAGKQQTVLQAVNFGLLRGERVALLGSSGSGKSTLLHLLGGIEPVSSGSITMQGITLSQLAEPDLTLFRREHIGFIYQQFNLIPTLTVAENIGLPLSLLQFSLEVQQQRLAWWLEAIGLAKRGRTFPDQLSGGEQQRVAIARALIHQPALVLADEPTGNLDAKTGEHILQLLFELSREAQQTLLMVTHSQVVARRAERCLVLQQGQLHEGGMEQTW